MTAEQVIDGEHELYALSIAVMLGVRTSIGSTNTGLKPKEKRWLSSDDFMASEKYEFRPSVSAPWLRWLPAMPM